MQDTIYTRALANAAEAQGSRQALAAALRVPENTLARWMTGRAQMPVQAFCKLIELLVQHETATAGVPLPPVEATALAQAPIAGQPAPGQTLRFAMGQHVARCARCEATDFVLGGDGGLKYTSELRCRACGTPVTHAALVTQLAKDAVYQSRAMIAARERRQKALAARRQPVES